MPEITLAKALKIKNRLTGRLAKVQSDVTTYNSVPEKQADSRLVVFSEEFRTQLIPPRLGEDGVRTLALQPVGRLSGIVPAASDARRGSFWPALAIIRKDRQIAGLVIPLIALLSWGFTPLALSFRPIELAAMAVAAALPALVLRTGRTTRLGGAILLAAYSALAVAAYLDGDP